MWNIQIYAVSGRLPGNHFLLLTFKCLIQLIFPKDDPQVVDSTGVELHPEYHVSAGAAVLFVVALELKDESHEIHQAQVLVCFTGLTEVFCFYFNLFSVKFSVQIVTRVTRAEGLKTRG